MMIEL